MRTETRPWGTFEVLHESEAFWLKKLIISPGQSLSLQYHENREETWVTEDNGVLIQIGEWKTFMHPLSPYTVAKRTKHRITNTGQSSVTVIEWATGRPEESDIVRLDDDYGR